MNAVAAVERWADVVKAHLSFAARIYTREQILQVALACGLTLGDDGENTAQSYEDAARYIGAVRTVLGETAFVSAKLTAMNKARTLGLRPPGSRWFT